MSASQKLRNANRFDGFDDQPVQEPESDGWFPINNLDHGSYSFDGNQGNLSVQDFERYYTHLGPSNYPIQTSSSTASGSTISQTDENACASPISKSCLTEDADDLRHKIREFETAMLGLDSHVLDVFHITNTANTNQIAEAKKWKLVKEIISRRDLKEVLCACAKAISEHDMPVAECFIMELRQMVSVSGEPVQRLGAYMLEALVARLASSGSSICKALRCKEPASSTTELLSYMQILYEVCPYFKFGYMSANGAIAQATKDENKVHIIDFQISQGTQWLSLIQALASRPEGPPQLRITALDDATSAYARGGGLDIVGKRLSKLAESYMVPFEFHPVEISCSEVQLDDLSIRPGEAVAVNFALMLHHIPDESVDGQNHRDRLLRLVKSLSPKVVALVEQESNTNTAPFFPRFLETLRYYNAIFESIDVTLPREHRERINVEQHCLAREIVNIIACEGAERVERHELLRKWKSRFVMAGFKPYPLSAFFNATIKDLLQNYSEKYTLEERDGALYLGWMNQNLVASCAWI